MLIRRAMPTPTFCGSRTDSPQVGSSPTRACVSANRAFSEAIRMSQYSAISSPPVTAAPLIAPITGLDIGGHFGEMSGKLGGVAEFLEIQSGAEHRVGRR